MTKKNVTLTALPAILLTTKNFWLSYIYEIKCNTQQLMANWCLSSYHQGDIINIYKE